MTRTLCLASAIALSATFVAPGAFGAGTKECKSFDLYSKADGSQTQYVDIDGSGGNTAGDRMLGHRILQDEKGEKLGERYFVGFIHEVDAEGKEITRNSEVVIVLKAGVIFGTKQRIEGKDLPTKIFGGTGEFADATGTEEASRDGNNVVYHIRLNCAEPS